MAGLLPAGAEPLITEFLASNSTMLFDQDRESSDWIEVHNPDPTPVNLGGWYLTETASNRTRWQFPSRPPRAWPTSRAAPRSAAARTP